MELLRLLSTNEIVAQIACFLILLFILRAVFWNKVLAALDARKARIENDMRKIDDLKSSAEDLKHDYERHLSNIDQEARERISQALGQARMMADDIRKKADIDASRIIEKSKESIKAEVAEAKEALKDEIVDLTIAVTEKIIQERYTEADDKRLIEEYLKGLEKE